MEAQSFGQGKRGFWGERVEIFHFRSYPLFGSGGQFGEQTRALRGKLFYKGGQTLWVGFLGVDRGVNFCPVLALGGENWGDGSIGGFPQRGGYNWVIILHQRQNSLSGERGIF